MRRAAIHLGVGLPDRRPPQVSSNIVPEGVGMISAALTFRQFAASAVEDAQSLCRRIGIAEDEQQSLLESAATEPALRAAIAVAAGRLTPDDSLLIVSFAGHGRRPDPSSPRRDVAWALHDRTVSEPELVRLFEDVPAGIAVMLIGDHCFGLEALPTDAATRLAPAARKLISISAIGEQAVRVMTRTTLASVIERALFEPSACQTMRELAERLAAQPALDPKVWCSDASQWDRAPLA